MVPFVRDMHTSSGLLEELDDGMTLAEAEEQVLDYIREHCPEGSRPPLAGNTVGTDRIFLARDMPDLETFLHYRIVDVSSIKELVATVVPTRLLQRPRQAREPPGARRHPGEHRGAALLPGGGLRAAAGSGSADAKQLAQQHGGSLTGLGPEPEHRLTAGTLLAAPGPLRCRESWWV